LNQNSVFSIQKSEVQSQKSEKISIDKNIHVDCSLLIVFHRSTSPRTMSMLPIIATRSAIIPQRAISLITLKLTNPGPRALNAIRCSRPSLTCKIPIHRGAIRWRAYTSPGFGRIRFGIGRLNIAFRNLCKGLLDDPDTLFHSFIARCVDPNSCDRDPFRLCRRQRPIQTYDRLSTDHRAANPSSRPIREASSAARVVDRNVRWQDACVCGSFYKNFVVGQQVVEIANLRFKVCAEFFCPERQNRMECRARVRQSTYSYRAGVRRMSFQKIQNLFPSRKQ